MTDTVVRRPGPLPPEPPRPGPDRWWTNHRRVLGFVAGNAAAVLAFILASWWIEPVRELEGIVARRLPIVLYGLAVAALSWSWVRRPGAGPRAEGAGPGDRVLGLLVRRGTPAAAVMAYLVPLFGGWETARSPYMVGGVIPWSDASLYFGGAQRVLFEGGVDDYGASRPVNPAFLAVRLAVTGLDLRKALIIGSVLLGLACFFAAWTVARDLGAAAGLALFAGIYGFAFPAQSNVMTESLGVTFGALALACLWTAARSRNVPLGLAGLALMTVGQCVRSGTLLILPALALWLAFHHRRPGARLNWRVLGMAVAAVTLGLAINVAAVVATHGRLAALHGHSGFVLYGLATGHPSWSPGQPNWTQIFDDNPGVSLTGAEGSEFVNDEAMRAIREHPMLFAKAVARSGMNYLRGSHMGALAPIRSASLRDGVTLVALVVAAGFLYARRRSGLARLATDAALLAVFIPSIVPLQDPWKMGAFRPGMWLVVTLVGFVALAVVGTDRIAARIPFTLILVGLAACIASAPLLGTDSDSARNFAATVPLMAVPVAIAVGALTRPRTTRTTRATTPTATTTAAAGPDPDPDDDPGPARGTLRQWAPALVGGGILATALIGAPLAAAAVAKPPIAERRCPDGTLAHAFVGGVGVHIVGNRPGDENGLDQLELHALETYAPFGWRAGPAEIPGTNAGQTAATTTSDDPGPRTILAAINADGNDRVAYVNGDIDEPRGSVLYLCGRDEIDGISSVLSRVFWPKPVTFAFFTGVPLPEDANGRP